MLPGSEIIRSRTHPLARKIRALLDRTAIDKTLAILEGPKLVEEALASGIDLVEVAASLRFTQTTRGERLLHELAARGPAIRLMEEDLLGRLSELEHGEGLLAIARRPAFDDASLLEGTPLLIVCVGIQNPGNLGALFRTAEAAGASGALLTEGCADPFSWKAMRGSMGSAFRLPHRASLTVDDALAWLRTHGVRTVAVTVDAPVPYDEADLRRPTALLLGSEGAGLDESLVRSADALVRVPMKPTVESLNVGVAAGILLFEAARQRR